MADESRIDIEIAAKQTGDGLAKAEKGVRDIGDAAKKASSSGVAGWKAFAAASKTVQGAINGVKAAFGPLLLGIDIVTNLVRKFNDWRKSIEEAKEEARKLREEQDALARADWLDGMARAYGDIAASAKAASDELARANQLEDVALRNSRALRDAKLDVAEQEELNRAATDAERAEIASRYAGRRARFAAEDSSRDSGLQEARLRQAASAKEAEAGEIDAAADKEYKKRKLRFNRQVRREEESWRRLNRTETIRDNSGFTEGSQVRFEPSKKETEAHYKTLNELKKIEAEDDAAIAELRGKADALRREAGHLRGLAEGAAQAGEAAALAGRAKAMAQDRTHAADAAAVEAEREAIRKARRVAGPSGAGFEMALTRMQIEDEDARLEKAAGRRDSESRDAFEAKNRLDAAAANRGRGSRSESDYKAALAAYEKELAEEREAIRAFERVSSEHANNVRALAQRLKDQEKRLSEANALLSRSPGYAGNDN